MAFEKIRNGRIFVEVRVLDTEKLLNIFWNRNIKIYKVKKKNIATLMLEIDYLSYGEVKEIVDRLGGKIDIIKTEGFIFFLGSIKKRLSLVIGAVIFLVVLYFLSTYIWAIEITVQNDIPPFEIRKQLEGIGIKPGISKKSIAVKEIEKRLENINDDILWLRIRIEGSTLKVVIEEKINPPTAADNEYGNLVADKAGEIKRIYTYAGRAAVKVGQSVKSGDVIIEGIDGNEGTEYILPPSGVVIANTFYEKSMNVQISGTSLERSGNKESEIYISIFGKKIYLKKAIKDFKDYDRIEKSGKIFNKVIYYERVEKDVNLTEDDAQKLAIKELEQSLTNELSRESKIVDKLIVKETVNDGNLLIKVGFVVEQNIVNDVPVSY